MRASILTILSMLCLLGSTSLSAALATGSVEGIRFLQAEPVFLSDKDTATEPRESEDKDCD